MIYSSIFHQNSLFPSGKKFLKKKKNFENFNTSENNMISVKLDWTALDWTGLDWPRRFEGVIF